MRTALTLSLGAALALSLGGCGGDTGPAETVEAFVRAAAAEDYEMYCSLLAPGTVAAYEEASGGESCPDQMRAGPDDLAGELALDPGTLEITGTEISKDESTATVATSYEGATSQVPLVAVDGEWKVDLGTP